MTPVAKLRELSPRLAAAYAGKTRKTISRDINLLADEMNLIEVHYVGRARVGIRPRVEIIRAFLPLRANTE